jgi:hypothetical protein
MSIKMYDELTIEEHEGAWCVIDEKYHESVKLFLVERIDIETEAEEGNETRMIISENKTVLMQDIYDFDDLRFLWKR